MAPNKSLSSEPGFQSLGLSEPMLRALEDLSFAEPTPIQALAIPHLLEGRDLIGQAQTGTGKTAAFALPLLAKIDLKHRQPQLLVITPTRELAQQVCQAMGQFGKHLGGLEVLPVYGGQGMSHQLSGLKRGVHVVVGTPGRLIDHLERGTLKLDGLRALVLDEADEMLRMGFVEEVEKILEAAPETRQTALFSATMPAPIKKIAKRFLIEPEEVKTRSKETTVETVEQWLLPVRGEKSKVEALNRILMAEEYDGVIIFVRTKVATTELADVMASKGFHALALNGDMTQHARQDTVNKFKKRLSDILICTDVAARGLDVPRITHVLNYDMPRESESYVHRIGRTGRAGRAGKAILFAGSREQRMLRNIEQLAGRKLEVMKLPTAADIAEKRIRQFQERLTATLEKQELSRFRAVVEAYLEEMDGDALEVAAALTYLMQEARPFDVPEWKEDRRERRESPVSTTRPGKVSRRVEREERRSPVRREEAGGEPTRAPREERERAFARDTAPRKGEKGRNRGERDAAPRAERAPRGRREGQFPMERYRVSVGREHGLDPGNLVGAIANEAGLDRSFIGDIRISASHSTVELPEGMPPEVLAHLKKVWTCGVQLDLTPMGGGGGAKKGRTMPRKGASESRAAGKSGAARKSGRRTPRKGPGRG